MTSHGTKCKMWSWTISGIEERECIRKRDWEREGLKEKRKKERESEREKGKKEANTIKDIWANCWKLNSTVPMSNSLNLIIMKSKIICLFFGDTCWHIQ